MQSAGILAKLLNSVGYPTGLVREPDSNMDGCVELINTPVHIQVGDSYALVVKKQPDGTHRYFQAKLIAVQLFNDIKEALK